MFGRTSRQTPDADAVLARMESEEQDQLESMAYARGKGREAEEKQEFAKLTKAEQLARLVEKARDERDLKFDDHSALWVDGKKKDGEGEGQGQGEAGQGQGGGDKKAQEGQAGAEGKEEEVELEKVQEKRFRRQTNDWYGDRLTLLKFEIEEENGWHDPEREEQKRAAGHDNAVANTAHRGVSALELLLRGGRAQEERWGTGPQDGSGATGGGTNFYQGANTGDAEEIGDEGSGDDEKWEDEGGAWDDLQEWLEPPKLQ